MAQILTALLLCSISFLSTCAINSFSTSQEIHSAQNKSAFEFKSNGREVGIFYWTWFPEAWGYGTWGAPAIGKYRSDANNIIDQHCEWLADAGVDFVVIDWSNNCLPYGDPQNPNHIETYTRAFVDRLAQRHRNGQRVVRYSIMLGTCGHMEYLSNGMIWKKAEQVNQWFLNNGDYNFLYYRYRGQVPFMTLFSPSDEGTAENFNHAAFWTRVMGAGLSDNGHINEAYQSRYMTYEDRWLPAFPSYETLYANEGHTEQTVQVGCRAPSGWQDSDPSHGRRCRDNGNTFRSWWTLAKQRQVNLAIVHSFNQWGGPGEELSQECSTDIEPMQGGHGSSYLQLLKEQITSYKSNSQNTAKE